MKAKIKEILKEELLKDESAFYIHLCERIDEVM
jgi:hypothetical protein